VSRSDSIFATASSVVFAPWMLMVVEGLPSELSLSSEESCSSC
jgi:hypothetical protein